MLNWAVDRDFICVNPLAHVRPPRPVRARERVLSDPEIRELWATDGLMSDMAKFQLLTGQRSGSIAQMRWDEIDLTTYTWNIPGQSMKSGRPHQVPLSASAAAVLQQRRRLHGPYVFGVGSLGSKPFNGASKGMKALRSKAGGSNWRLHDLRRTAVSLAQRGGSPLEEIAALTQHRSGGILAVYARHAYEPEKRRVVMAIEREVLAVLPQEPVD